MPTAVERERYLRSDAVARRRTLWIRRCRPGGRQPPDRRHDGRADARPARPRHQLERVFVNVTSTTPDPGSTTTFPCARSGVPTSQLDGATAIAETGLFAGTCCITVTFAPPANEPLNGTQYPPGAGPAGTEIIWLLAEFVKV